MKRMRRPTTTICALAALAVAAAAGAVPAWNGTIEQEDGWKVVSNPAAPAGPDEVLDTQQLWRIGAAEDDPLFGLIEDALVDETGTSYLLDTVLSQVHVVSPAGEVTGTISGEGDGPGEFRFAREMVFLPDGALGIMEMMPGKIVSVARDGTPRPSFALGEGESAMSHMTHIATNDHTVLVGTVMTNIDESGARTDYALTAFDADGARRAVLKENHVEQHGGAISLNFGSGENDFTMRFALCPDDRVVLFPEAGGYQLEVYDSQGRPDRKIRRDYKSIRRTDKDLEAARKRAASIRRSTNGGAALEVDEMARDIQGVVARPDGSLWVLSSQGDRDRPAGTVGFYDVIDRDGRFQHRVAVRADYDSDRDRYAFSGDRLYVFKEAAKAPPRTQRMGGGGGASMVMIVGSGSSADEEDEEEEAKPYEVICYRLPR